MIPLGDIIFPKLCISCNRQGSHLCEDCLALFQINPTDSPLERTSFLSGLFSATSYENPLLQKVIYNFKYPPFLKDLSFPLTSLIISYFALLDKPRVFSNPQQTNPRGKSDYILCPMPLFKSRLRWRGFNQAEELARRLSEFLSFPLVVDSLIKVRNTRPQIELSRELRKENMQGAFGIQNKEHIQHKKILLVDDIYTTGASMEEAAKTLKQSGASKVYGIVVARG